MGRLRLRQGPPQLRLSGRISRCSSLLGLIFGLGLLCAAPSAWAGVGITNGVLVYTARTGDVNHVSVSLSGTDYVVTDVVPIDADVSGGCSVSGNTATCPADLVARIRIDAKDGDDVIAIDPAITIPASLIGGAGPDTVDYSGYSGGVSV